MLPHMCAVQKEDGADLGQLCQGLRIDSFLDAEGVQPSAAEFLRGKGLEQAVQQ